MASSYDNSVCDFDLDFLRGNTNNTLEPSKIKKQRTSVLVLKKKIVSTELLIWKYRSYKESLEQQESLLAFSTQERKQICLDYKNALEKCENLEKEIQLLRAKNLDLEEKTSTADNREAAEKSYINQLQLLVKDRDTAIKSLKVDSNLHKENIRALQKRLRKQKYGFTKNLYNIAQMVFRKKPLNKKGKMFLMKHLKGNKKQEMEFASEAESSSGDEEASDDVPVSPGADSCDDNEMDHTTDEIPSIQGIIIKSHDKKDDQDSEVFSEAVSVDTGRGSSLAFSDSDKCTNSPDYYLTNSPLNETFPNKKVADSSTSPITIKKSVEIATSPIIFEQESIESQVSIKDVSLKQLINKGTSPIKSSSSCIMPKLIDSGTIPMKLSLSEEESPRRVVSSRYNINDCNEDSTNEHECLELNNSHNLHVDNSDVEIEMILNTMRLKHDIITPIPPTPARSVVEKTRSLSITDNESTSVCPEVEKLREENKKVYSDINYLSKEIMSIKHLLKIHGNKLGIAEPEIQNSGSESNYMSTENSVCNGERTSVTTTHKIYNSEQICLPIDDNVSDDEHRLIILEDLICSSEQPKGLNNSAIQNPEENAENESCISPAFAIPNPPICDNSTLNTAESLQFEPDSETEAAEESADGILENNCSNPESLHNIIVNKKAKKLTRLGKLRKSMLPKSKIKKAEQPASRKLRKRVKQLSLCNGNTRNMNPLATANNKAALEKAIKVMAELKVKEKEDAFKTFKSNKKSLTTSVVIEHDNKLNTKNSIDSAIESNMGTKDVTISEKNPVSIKSCMKRLSCDKEAIVVLSRIEVEEKKNDVRGTEAKESIGAKVISKNRKRSKRLSNDLPETQSKRILRSSAVQSVINLKNDTEKSTDKDSKNDKSSELLIISIPKSDNQKQKNCEEVNSPSKLVDYNDIDIFSDEPYPKKLKKSHDISIENLQDSLLCKMIQKYSNPINKHQPKKISDTVVNSICKKIENSISNINELPSLETKPAMNKLVEEIQKMKLKEFLSGLMLYLKDPQRKMELLNKINVHPAPPMTKSEQVLLYVVTRLKGYWPDVDIIDCILTHIESTLFKLNNTPDFQIVESMSHFYAVLCRYKKSMSRLRLFILDAMYCIQFKAVPLIKQCMEVWMHVLPLAHMGTAKNPLVTCLVYLLHFYKCEDKFNRVQEIRSILSRRYFFTPTDWNETKIIELFTNAIKELKDCPVERKMLRLSLLVLAKRHGTRWCQNKIVQSVLQPIIAAKDVSYKTKEFCVSILGSLLKPYPMDMKVHCEIIMNQLIDMLSQNPSSTMKEAIFTSLIRMSKHNSTRVIQALLSWRAEQVSPELNIIMRDFVKERPVRVWKSILSKVTLFQ